MTPSSKTMGARPTWERVIGIVGGLGPHAHVEFETLLLSATENALGRPALDQDYPPWVLSSLPSTPDRTRALLEGSESPVEALVRSASRLQGADFAVIPCNTAHAFLEEVRLRASIPFLDMIRVTAERALARVGPGGAIGILAASGTLRSGIYTAKIRALSSKARVLTPFDLEDGEAVQERLVSVPIFGPLTADGRRAGGGIKSGSFRDPRKKEELAEPMREATRRLAAAGAEIVLTACTEIPLVLGRERVGEVPLLDPMAVAAEAAIEIALGGRPLPLTLPT
jgi:aspartate racemase